MFTIKKSSMMYISWTVGLVCSVFSVSESNAGCSSETLTNRTGVISTLHIPGTSFCKYWFIQGEPNMTITISFSTLDIQTNPNGTCGINKVKLGPDPEHIYCGTNKTPYIATIRRDHVWLSFYTNNLTRDKMELRYIVDFVPSRELCDINEMRCYNGKCIPRIWKCNNHSECDSDEENCDERHCAGEWMCRNYRCIPWSTRCNSINDCGDNSDEEQCSTQPERRTTRRWTTTPLPIGCSRRYLTHMYGRFNSPQFPSYYPNNMECVWIIESATSSDKIQLRFSMFRLQDEPNTDYVAVYDGPNEHSRLKGVYYGAFQPPDVIESSSNILFVKFHSDFRYRKGGFNASYQRKGTCMPGQNSCGDRERDCYLASQKCDGVWNCPKHGHDEQGCGACTSGMYSCGTSKKCYSSDERCNGKSFCLNNADEFNCTSDRCGPHKGLFLCRNKRCIYESWECDRTSDCEDHSDEEGCPSPFFTRRVIVAAVAGSLICSLLLVIALGCICKVYALRMHEQYGSRNESPLSRVQAEIFRRRAPPPPYNEAMLTSRPYEEARREYLNQSRDQRRRRSSERRRNRGLPPTPEEPTMHQIGTAAACAGDTESGSGNDVQLLSLNSTNLQGVNNDTSSTADLIPPTTSSDSEDNGVYNQACDDDDDDDDDSVLLDLSEGVGGTATWRSISRHASEDERSPEHIPSDVDSASANISVDDMSLALHETLDKQNGVEADIVDKETSVDQEFPATSQSSISTSVPEEQFSTMEHIKNQ